MINLGDVISIPFGNRIAAGKVIYLSKFMKDVFGFVVLPRIFEATETVEVVDGHHLPIKLPYETRRVLYADVKAITKRNKWPVIGSLAVTEAENALLLHGVGGTLYSGDESVKVFESIEERKSYPQIKTSGDVAIENILTHVFGDS